MSDYVIKHLEQRTVGSVIDIMNLMDELGSLLFDIEKKADINLFLERNQINLKLRRVLDYLMDCNWNESACLYRNVHGRDNEFLKQRVEANVKYATTKLQRQEKE